MEKLQSKQPIYHLQGLEIIVLKSSYSIFVTLRVWVDIKAGLYIEILIYR